MQINNTLDKEIDELEQYIFGTQNEEEVEETTDLQLESTKEDEEVQHTEPTEEVIVQKKEKDNSQEDYEKRFKNYKAKTDLTIRDLRSELATSKSKYANLQTEYSKLYEKYSSLLKEEKISIFSDEESDILGSDTTSAINRGVTNILDSRIKPLEEELVKTRKALAEKEAEEAVNYAKRNYDKFLEKLGNLVPNYAVVNVDPKFIEYMNEADDDSGLPNGELFKRAEEALDVKRVAQFFNEFLSRGKKGQDILTQSITPSGVQSSKQEVKQNSKTPIITRKFIDKFYEDYARGKYKGTQGRKEAARIEALIDEAVYSGNIS